MWTGAWRYCLPAGRVNVMKVLFQVEGAAQLTRLDYLQFRTETTANIAAQEHSGSLSVAITAVSVTGAP